MSLKVKAKEREFKVGKYAGEYRYVMVPEMYSALAKEKVIREAALRSGVSEGVMHACWDAAGEVIKAWATEGHSVALPGLGTMRFSLSAKSVADVNDVKTSLIKVRRIVFTPAVELKDELKNTSVGADAKVPHLSYLGDAALGAGSNVGCGTVTANFDRVEKHYTVVEEGAFLGCHTTLVAPVNVGQGAYVAAGSVITEDVPPQALAISRPRAQLKKDWALKNKLPEP